ncbi:MAG TPA: HEPN domain-containing protein [Chloroflexota bacterium]|jgi:HEPN domain-containing protein|nr:HEPN domain-containing protein [Chloroflexota bacterium]
MPLDPELVAETRAWLSRARRDLDTAAFELTAALPFAADAVFHAQQAAEKALKGFLTWHSSPFRKTHNLEELGEQCLQFEPALKPVIDRAVPLTKYAWKYRYPGEPEEPSQQEAEAALALAREVYDAVLARLPEEVRP